MRNKNLRLCLLSGLLLALPWYTSFSGLLLLIAFIPLLFVEDDFAKNKKKHTFIYFYLCFFIWNALSVWWVSNATLGGGIAAVTINAAQMAFVFWLFHWVKKHTNERVGYATLIAAWITWEWIYLNGEISFPWLVLGNGFGKDIKLIQWYEFSGALGGSLWVLICNISLFFILRKWSYGISFKQQWIEVARQVLLIALPITMSLILFYQYNEKEDPCKVLILQPNIDPYNDKFNGMSNQQQLDTILNLTKQNINPSYDYVIGPETALNDRIWENEINEHPNILQIKETIAHYPKVNFVIGLTSLKYYKPGETPSSTARKYSDANEYYDVYNASMQINNVSNVDLYHKSKLVIGAEMLPYVNKLKFLTKFSIDLGGISGRYGTQPERSLFTSADQRFKAGTAICYESIYGEYYTEYVRKGANIMFIITNDGWWKDTPGYRQHLSYASLRAIETRRSIARSGNTGISALINQRGEILDHTNWWERTTLSGTINANTKITFYTVFGDAIGRISAFMFVLLFGYALVQKIRNKNPLIR